MEGRRNPGLQGEKALLKGPYGVPIDRKLNLANYDSWFRALYTRGFPGEVSHGQQEVVRPGLC